MILDELAAHAQQRVAEAKEHKSLEQIRAEALAMPPKKHAFSKAIGKPGLSFICEIKKASPSKGIIAEDFPYVQIAREYQAAGADCISCLTEPKWFLGSDAIFSEVRAATTLPMIRKDFTMDEYQLYEARLLDADAVLLICALLDTETIKRYLEICEELGLDALVETHDEAEIASAAEAGAKLIGVNNRNLKTFDVDFSNAQKLRSLIPEKALYIAESGVKTPEDIASVSAIGADGVLIGEAFMRSADKIALMQEYRAVSKVSA